MTTEQTAQQLELAAQIIRTGHPWKSFPQAPDTDIYSALRDGFEIRPILATPPDNRPLHNPDNLTAEQVGAGYRLPLEEEEANQPHEMWDTKIYQWVKTIKGSAKFKTYPRTYRLPLSVPWPKTQPDPYAELKKAHADGKVIQGFFRGDESWVNLATPSWKDPVECYRIKPEEPTFQLPPPPPGMQWHREDGWKEGDLPQGIRPLVINEESQPGDEHWTLGRGPWKTLKAGGIIYDEGHTRCRTRRPLTFTHAGKQWTWRRPGDPMPCDGERYVALLQQLDLATFSELGSNGTSLGREWHWGDDLIIGWRYADKKKTVPLGPEDVPPGSAFRIKSSNTGPHGYCIPVSVDFDGCDFPSRGGIGALVDWEALAEEWQINRSIPLTGKWNPDAWEPCHKIIPENG